MRRLASAGLAALGLALAVAPALAPPARAAEVQVLIQGFEYRPSTVEIDPGDVVAWTNVDGTAHTVTADDGSFDSGRMPEGGRFAIAFNRPGTYAYHCTLHDHAGTVTVRGDATTSTTTAATTSTAAPAPTSTSTAPPSTAPGPSTTAGPTTTGPPTSTTATAVAAAPAPSAPVPTSTVTTGAGAAGAFDVVSAPLTTAPLPLSPPWVVGGVGVLAAVAAAQVWVVAPRRLRLLAALLTALAGAIHLQLRLDLDYPEPVASLFVAQGVIGLAVAAALVWWRSTSAWWAAVVFHLASLGGFVVSRTIGLFGFHERGWDPSPQAALAVAVELAALGVLALVRQRRGGTSQPASAASAIAAP